MASVTKADLINTIAKNADIKKTEAEHALGAALEGIKAALANGDKVTLVGFGTFAVQHRAARTGRDPRTRQAIQIAESNTVKFKAGKAFKAIV